MKDTMLETLIKSECKDDRDVPHGTAWKTVHRRIGVSRKMFNVWLKQPEKIDKANLLLISRLFNVPVMKLRNIYGCGQLTKKEAEELEKL